MISPRNVAHTALGAVFACGAALALPPDQIFERVAPGVWSVKAYSADEKLLASASGVVVAPGKLVTSCQVLARARQVQLRRGNTIFDAKLEFPDVERDLCQLDAPGLTAAAPAVGAARALRPGQRLYVVGFSRGNEQSIGEGLVSALADAGTGKERLQTTVPASPGLRGAGVFDEQARLVGVVTASPADAPATAFAVPAEWLAELATRGAAALAARAKSTAAGSAGAAAPGLPSVGTAWVYGYNDRIFGRGQTEITVRVVRADSTSVEEHLAASASQAREARRTVIAAEARFFDYPLSSSTSLVELAPYLFSANGGKVPTEIAIPIDYPQGGAALPGWAMTARLIDWEQVTVPAGTFRAFHVEVRGKRKGPVNTRTAESSHFTLGIWYAPDVKRCIRIEHRVWSKGGADNRLIVHDVVELLSYKPRS